MKKNYLTWEYALIILPLSVMIFSYWQELIRIPSEYYYFIIPLLITVLFFIIQTLQRKDDQSDTQITFIENEGTFILNSVGFSLNELYLHHDKTQIDKKAILYQVTILNSGIKDIDKQDFQKPLVIKLGSEYTWKTIDITYKSEDIGLLYSLKNDTLIFEWELLRTKEFFKFDSIIEFKQEYNKDNIRRIFQGVLKNISFKGSRIKNVKFQRTNFAKGESNIWKLKLLIPFLAMMTFSYFHFTNPEKIIYHHIVTDKNDTLCVNFQTTKDKIIIIKDSLGKNLDYNRIAYSNWKTQKIEVVDNLSWVKQKPILLKIISWLLFTYLILLLFQRNYYLRRKEINDFIAYPYMGSPK